MLGTSAEKYDNNAAAGEGVVIPDEEPKHTILICQLTSIAHFDNNTISTSYNNYCSSCMHKNIVV